jgi:hypothetical protein
LVAYFIPLGAAVSVNAVPERSYNNRISPQVGITGTGGQVRISGATVDPKRLDWLAGPANVNVNVASARKSSPDNLLDCDFIDGALANVRKQRLRFGAT